MNHPVLRSSLLLLVLALASGCPGPTSPTGLTAPKASRNPKSQASPSPTASLPVLATSSAPSTPASPATSLAPSTQPTTPTTSPTTPAASPTSSSSPSASPEPSNSPSTSPSPTPSASASPAAVAVSTFAGGTAGLAEGTGAEARFNSPNGIDADSAGNLYVADAGNHRIRKITPEGVVSTFAGSDQGFSDGPAATAKFNSPYGVAVGPNGDVFVADTGNHQIRRITPAGDVTTIAGGAEGFVNATGTSARFRSPFSLTCDGFGTIYVADTGNHAIRMIATDGATTTLLGNGQGYIDGLFSVAQLSVPNDISLDLTGQLIIADFNNHTIRRVDRSTTQVESLVGNGTAGSANGTKADARLNLPTGIAVDSMGRILIADNQNHRICIWSLTGELTTLAGAEKGLQNGTPSQARFNEPTDLVVTGGAVFVADAANNLIRKIILPASLLSSTPLAARGEESSDRES